MNHPPRRLLILYQFIAGLCDTGTGALLIAAPEWTLRLMGLHLIPQPVVFVRYIGVFVLSVGLTYLWALARWPLTSHAHIGWATQWKITALVRLLVAVFVFWQVASGGLEIGWIMVAISDAAFATVQWVGLRNGWLSNAS
jgi:hypothetical protein